MANLAKIMPCYMARLYQDMYELAISLNGCQETRSWQDFQERLIMTWQDVPSIKNSIAPKNMNWHEIIRLNKNYRDLLRISKSYQECW